MSRRTVWSGIFRYRRASEVWLAAAGPSRCWAAPRGWALRLPAHTSGNTRRDRQQSSGSQGGYPAGCRPRWLRVRCTCRPRRSQQPQGQSFHGGQTPIRWDPPHSLRTAGVKSRLTRPSGGATWNIFTGSRTHRWKNSNCELVRLLKGRSTCLTELMEKWQWNKTKKKTHCAFNSWTPRPQRKLVSFLGKHKHDSDINHRATDHLVTAPPWLIPWRWTQKESCSPSEAWWKTFRNGFVMELQVSKGWKKLFSALLILKGRCDQMRWCKSIHCEAWKFCGVNVL